MENRVLVRRFRRLLDEHDFVAAAELMSDAIRWWVPRSTADGEDYANDYHCLYRCEDGRIAEVWEHLDTAYALSKFKA